MHTSSNKDQVKARKENASDGILLFVNDSIPKTKFRTNRDKMACLGTEKWRRRRIGQQMRLSTRQSAPPSAFPPARSGQDRCALQKLFLKVPFLSWIEAEFRPPRVRGLGWGNPRI